MNLWGSHQEYVTFRNGRLESWGRGTLPGALKGKTSGLSKPKA
jgi:hypothetical protein